MLHLIDWKMAGSIVVFGAVAWVVLKQMTKK